MATWESIIEKANALGPGANYAGSMHRQMMLDLIEKIRENTIETGTWEPEPTEINNASAVSIIPVAYQRVNKFVTAVIFVDVSLETGQLFTWFNINLPINVEWASARDCTCLTDVARNLVSITVSPAQDEEGLVNNYARVELEGESEGASIAGLVLTIIYKLP